MASNWIDGWEEEAQGLWARVISHCQARHHCPSLVRFLRAHLFGLWNLAACSSHCLFVVISHVIRLYL